MTTRIALTIFCSALVLHLGVGMAWGIEKTYWVWHRKAPLIEKEVSLLTKQGVRTLYWHIGTLRPEGEGWRLDGGLDMPANRTTPIVLTPVLRLSPQGVAPLGEVAAKSVTQALGQVARQTEAAEVQIDFDCPDRRLPEYAEFLANCRARLAPIRLSATALAGWSRLPGFEKLQGSVDLLMPMFYDLLPDSPAQVRADRVIPLADAATLVTQIESWRSCRIPWFAGIPNFARITVFDRHGGSRGHLRAWDWDTVCFNPALSLRAQPAPGITLLRAATNTVVADTPLSAGEALACRWPDLTHPAQAIACAERSGATGVTIFRLPSAGSQGGWSLQQLDTLLRERKAGEPEFKLRSASHGLDLINVSGSDLPPRLAGPKGERDRGWQLEVQSSESAVFREANPGEFAHAFGHTDPDSAEPRRVAIPLAQRLTYWFADLRAGQSRQSGLLQLAPGVKLSSLRWRIPHSPRNSQWQPFE